MLLRGQRRLTSLLTALALIVFVVSISELYSLHGLRFHLESLTKAVFPSWSNPRGSSRIGPNTTGTLSSNLATIATTHSILISASTPGRKYFPILFGDLESCNPSIIPHPILLDRWIIVAQQLKGAEQDAFTFAELACTAAFVNDTLRCVDQAVVLPMLATSGPHCKDDLAHLSFNQGPHDARLFYGPTAPYTIYGSNSAHTCFGQWLHDFRFLMNWNPRAIESGVVAFGAPTDLQRPSPYQRIEKNWFIFWDGQGRPYVHHDIFPQRVFSELYLDWSVGPDLGPRARPSDDLCMARYMPKVGATLESIHQATNSLLMTLCARSEGGRACRPDHTNTFIMTIFQHKTFHSYHSVYEPYLMLFKQDAPFDIYAISKKPFWIHGRGVAGERRPSYLPLAPEDPWNQTEMAYVTSMSWKSRNQTYHGYQDDTLFLAFGIEDEKSAGIDILAADLLQDLGLCIG